MNASAEEASISPNIVVVMALQEHAMDLLGLDCTATEACMVIVAGERSRAWLVGDTH